MTSERDAPWEAGIAHWWLTSCSQHIFKGIFMQICSTKYWWKLVALVFHYLRHHNGEQQYLLATLIALRFQTAWGNSSWPELFSHSSRGFLLQAHCSLPWMVLRNGQGSHRDGCWYSKWWCIWKFMSVHIVHCNDSCTAFQFSCLDNLVGQLRKKCLPTWYLGTEQEITWSEVRLPPLHQLQRKEENWLLSTPYTSLATLAFVVPFLPSCSKRRKQLGIN